MAYLNQDEEELNPSNSGVLTTGSGGAQTAGPSTSLKSNAQAQSQATAQTQQAGGTNGATAPDKFVNFDRLLNANGDTAQRTADSVVAGLNADGTKAQNGILGLVDSFANKAKSSIPEYQAPTWTDQTTSAPIENLDADAYAPGTRQNSNGEYSKKQQHHDAVFNQLSKDNAPGGPNQKNHEQWQKLNAGSQVQYAGPHDVTDMSGFGDVQNSITGVDGIVAKTAATQSNEGLQGILDQHNGVYGNAMNAALTGAKGQQQFNDLNNRWGNLGSVLDNVVTSSGGLGNAAAQATNAVGARYGQDMQDRTASQALENETQMAANDPWNYKPEGWDQSQATDAAFAKAGDVVSSAVSGFDNVSPYGLAKQGGGGFQYDPSHYYDRDGSVYHQAEDGGLDYVVDKGGKKHYILRRNEDVGSRSDYTKGEDGRVHFVGTGKNTKQKK